MICKNSRRTLIGLVLTIGVLITMPALAIEKNLDETGLALHGYDPVSYFEASSPIKGNEKFMAEHDGARYQFASIDSLEKFRANPDRYTPQYGGYCAYGVRVGRKFDIDPDAYRVVDDKLYLQLNFGTQVIWLINLRENINVADKIWPLIIARTDTELEAEAEKAVKQDNN